MPADESTRLRIRQYLIELMDEQAADAMMESMPPIPWTELATKSDIARLDGSLMKVHDRLGSVEGRVDRLGDRVDGLSDRMDGMSDRMDSMSDRMDSMSDRLSQRMDTMSERLDGLGTRMDDIGRAIAAGALTMAVMLAIFIAGTVASLIGAGAFG